MDPTGKVSTGGQGGTNAQKGPAPQKPSEARPIARKRLFLGLITGTAAFLCLFLVISWGIPYIGFSSLYLPFAYITGSSVVLLALFISWIALTLAMQVMTGRAWFGTRTTRSLTIKFFLPVMEICGRFAGVNPTEVRRSFIQVNNELIYGSAHKYSPGELMVLLPHCIQWRGCNIRVSNKLERCKKCGQCGISALLDLTERYGVHLAIATGGTIARKLVVQLRPRLIIAVACERDLTSGIQDTYPLPVYGILNNRPHGPCIDTEVDLESVELALQRFIK